MLYEFQHIMDTDEDDEKGTVEVCDIDHITTMFPEISKKLFTNFNLTVLVIGTEKDGEHSRFIFRKKD